MSSKDILSMLDEITEQMSKQTTLTSTTATSNTSDHLFAIDKVIRELDGNDEDTSDDILGFYDGQSNSSELARQGNCEEDDSSVNALELYQQAMMGKSVEAESTQPSESDSTTDPTRDEATSSSKLSLVRTVSFSTEGAIAISYDENTPLSQPNTPTAVSRTSSKKSILKTPTSDTQPSEIPMIPSEDTGTSSDDGSSISDESESSGQGDLSDEEMPSDQEDEDIEIKEDGLLPSSGDFYGGGFGSEFRLDIQTDEDSLTDQMKVLINRKFSQEEIKTAPSTDKVPSLQQQHQPGGVFLYFGQNATSTPPSTVDPPPKRRPSVDKHTPTMQSKQRRPSVDDIQKPLSDAKVVDDDNVPIMQAFRRPSISDSVKNITASELTQSLMTRLAEGGALRKITTRIYIETPAIYETKSITSFMNADQVAKEVVEARLDCSTEDSALWTVFELCSDIGIERPLRDWEIVTDVMSAWNNEESTNVLILKKYPYKSTLSLSNIRGTYPKSQGFIYLELTPGKWSKRFVELRQHTLYYLKNHMDPNSLTFLCSLSHFDVFSTFRPHKNAATPYCFGLRSDMNMSVFKGDKSEYVRFMCVEKEERLLDWVLALRMAKGERMAQLARNPELSREEVINIPSSSSSNRSISAAATTARAGESQEIEKKLTPGSLLENLEQSSSSSTRKGKKKSSSSSSKGTDDKGERSKSKSSSSKSKSSSSKSKKSSSSKTRKPKPLIEL